MCSLFAHQPQRDYESQTRSLRMGGHCTSIRLEMSFWDTLEEIAAKEEMSLAKFLTTLHNEVLDHHGEVNNFASLLRCSCLIYRSKSAAVVPDADQLGGHLGPRADRRPARPYPIHAAFINEHDAQPPPAPSGDPPSFSHSIRKAVFLKAFCAARSRLG
jgi:predicted DNA-binding ribbon-helix-helix protein